MILEWVLGPMTSVLIREGEGNLTHKHRTDTGKKAT